MRGLAGRQRPELKPQLLALLDDDTLRRDAIRAIASFDDDSLAKALLDRYANFSTEEKLDVVHALASRQGHGWQLTQAIQRGDVARREFLCEGLCKADDSGFGRSVVGLSALSSEAYD